MNLAKTILTALIFLNACNISAAARSSTSESVRKQMEKESREELNKKQQEEKKRKEENEKEEQKSEEKKISTTKLRLDPAIKTGAVKKNELTFNYESNLFLDKILGPSKDNDALPACIKNGLPQVLIDHIKELVIHKYYSKNPATLKPHDSAITFLTKISEFGFASGSEKGDIHVVYNTNPFKSIKLSNHKHPIGNLLMLSNEHLLSQAADGIIIWDLKTGKPLWAYTFDELDYSKCPVVKLEKDIIAFATNQMLYIYDWKQNKLVGKFTFFSSINNLIKLPNNNLTIICKNAKHDPVIFFFDYLSGLTDKSMGGRPLTYLYKLKNNLAAVCNYIPTPLIFIYDFNGNLLNRIDTFSTSTQIHSLKELEDGALLCLTNNSLNLIAGNELAAGANTMLPLYDCNAKEFFILDDDQAIVTVSQNDIDIFYRHDAADNHHVKLYSSEKEIIDNVFEITSGKIKILVAATNNEILMFHQAYDIKSTPPATKNTPSSTKENKEAKKETKKLNNRHCNIM